MRTPLQQENAKENSVRRRITTLTTERIDNFMLERKEKENLEQDFRLTDASDVRRVVRIVVQNNERDYLFGNSVLSSARKF